VGVKMLSRVSNSSTAVGAATLTRYILRKELMQDIRGLRKEIRREELL